MANLKDIIYLSAEDYNTLYTNGTVTINGTTLTYDANNVYIVPDDTDAKISTALANYIAKSSTAGLVKNDGTIDTNTYALSSALSDYIAKSNTAGLVKNDGTILSSNSVSTQSQSTKFLREDGTWQAPSYTTNTNTTYELSQGDSNGQIKVTPSSGSAYNVSVKGLGSDAYKSNIYSSGTTTSFQHAFQGGHTYLVICRNNGYAFVAMFRADGSISSSNVTWYWTVLHNDSSKFSYETNSQGTLALKYDNSYGTWPTLFIKIA